MAERVSLEEVSIYPMDEEKREQLYRVQSECSICWSTSDGWPVGVIHHYLWHDGRIWATCSGQRKRVPALRRSPKSCVIISGAGTEVGGNHSVTIKTLCRVRDDRETKDWFYAALARRLAPGSESGQKYFAEMLDTPRRVVLELKPVKFITYDGSKLAAASRG